MFGPTILINIVLYNPDPNKVLELMRICCIYQHAKILLFDNSNNLQLLNYKKSEKIISYKSSQNAGIAGAHYYACKLAENENYDFLLFLDQDTQLPEYFINNMISEFYRLQKIYSRLVAIGPSWRDARTYDWYQEKNNKVTVKNILKKKFKIAIKINNLIKLNNVIISSGMLVLVKFLKDTGYPKKEYFIDLVDLEWCLRAFSKVIMLK
jgi:rhamnosyltransferase